MNELLSEILKWYEKQQSPNSDRKYHKCPVCNATWWNDGGIFGVERHNFDCWIPRLQNTSKNTYMKLIDKGKGEFYFVGELDELE